MKVKNEDLKLASCQYATEKTQDQNGVTYWSVVPFFGILKNSAKKNPAVGPVEVKA